VVPVKYTRRYLLQCFNSQGPGGRGLLAPAGSPYENRRYGLQNLVDRSHIERITWHDLRRTYGCRMLQDHGLSMEEVRQLMGHSSVVVTEQAYAFLNVGKIQKKLREGPHKIPHNAVESTP